MPTWQVTSSGWFLRTGTTNMSSVKLWYHKVSGNFLKSLNASKRPNWPRRLETGLNMPPILSTHPRGRWSPLVTGFQRDTAQRNTGLSVRNMGLHTPHITLQTAGIMIPMGPLRGTSKGQNQLEPLVDPRDLFKEEVAMCNYPLKLTNLKSPTRKSNVP